MTGRQRSTARADGSFDAFDVATRGLLLSGTVDGFALPRVADRLTEGAASVAWQIAGAVDALGRPALEIVLDGAVPLECQRCLRTFSWRVAQRTLVLLARDDRELARLDGDDAHEVIVAAMPQDALALVEDELLLTLPFAPRCDSDDCATVTASGVSAESAVDPAARHSAFDALAGLKVGPASKPKG
jgi:uncharacterized protein